MQKYKIQIHGSERVLGFKLKLFSNKHEVFLDGEKIGQFENAKEAKIGKDFRLDEENIVHLKYSSSGLHNDVYVSLNGVILEESAVHPKYRKKSAFYLMLLLMALNFIVGFIGAYNAISTVNEAGFGTYNIFIACFYLLAVWMFKRSDPFLGIFLALCIYSIDTVITVINIAGNPGLAGAMVTRVIFYTILIKGLKSSWPSFKEIFVKT